MKLTKQNKILLYTGAGILLIFLLKKAVDKFKLFDKFYKRTSPFGNRTHPVKKTVQFHNGVDYATPTGTPLYSAFDGIIGTKTDQYNGLQVNITNNKLGYRIIYNHLSKFAVKPGQTIKKGELIGYSGNTGTSTGPHLHLSLYNLKTKAYVNPEPFVINSLST